MTAMPARRCVREEQVREQVPQQRPQNSRTRENSRQVHLVDLDQRKTTGFRDEEEHVGREERNRRRPDEGAVGDQSAGQLRSRGARDRAKSEFVLSTHIFDCRFPYPSSVI